MVNAVKIPSTGQPLDIKYIGEIITAVNGIANEFSTSSSISALGTAREDISTSELRTSMISVYANSVLVGQGQRSYPITFSFAFKDFPVVLFSIEGSNDGAYLSKSSKQGAEIVFTGANGLSKDIILHILAIGKAEKRV